MLSAILAGVIRRQEDAFSLPIVNARRFQVTTPGY